MMRVLLAVATVVSTAATLLSDTGCQCALVKGSVSTPSAAASVAAGCSTKLDWNGAQTRWCLTDETAGVAAPCGTLQAGFGYVDSCIGAGFTAADVTSAPAPFYTGQNLSVTWSTTQFTADELIRLTFNGRTLATNVSSFEGGITVRATAAGANQSVVLASQSSPAVTRNTTQLITVLQSALTAVNATYNGMSITGTTQVLDDRNITLSWAGVGDASTGNTTIILRSTGGTRLVGSALWTTNSSIAYVLPRSFVPSGGGGGGGTQYLAALSLLSPTGTIYTLNSATFSLVAAPTPTPTPSATRSPSTPSYTSSISLTPSITPSQTTTPTQTPTSSLSFGATASNTPSVTPTGSSTPSPTPTSSLTPSLTSTTSLTSSPTPTGTPSQTAAASVDYVGIAAAQAAATAAQTNALVAGLIGGIFGFLVIGLGSYKLYQRYQYRQRRLRGLQATAKRLARAEHIQESATIVGLDPAIYEFTRPKTHRPQGLQRPQRQVPQAQQPQTLQQRQQDRVRR